MKRDTSREERALDLAAPSPGRGHAAVGRPRPNDPVAALGAARAELGDTFEVESGRDRYLFVFSPAGLHAFYALPERDASKGLADYRMLVRKLPEELFSGVRTLAHDLFGAQDVEGYPATSTTRLDLELAELGPEGTLDAFGFARRVAHRLGLACWIGDLAAEPPWFDRLVGELDQLDGADAFVRPAGMAGVATAEKRVERAALAASSSRSASCSPGPTATAVASSTRSRVAGPDTDDPQRTQGIAVDVVLLHVATMTNLFAALGWTLAHLALHPDVFGRVAVLARPACSNGARSSRHASASAR